MSKFTYRQLLVVGTMLAGIATAPMYGEAEELETAGDDSFTILPSNQSVESSGKGLMAAKEIKVMESASKEVTSQPEPVEPETMTEVLIETEVGGTTRVDPVYEAEEQVFEETVPANAEETITEIVNDNTQALKSDTLVAAENVAQLVKADGTVDDTKTTVAAGYGQTIGELFTDPNFANEIVRQLKVADTKVVLTEELANSLTEIYSNQKNISNIGATRFLVKS